MASWRGAILLILITALVLRARDRRYLIVGWLWFLGSLVPMLGLVQVGAQAIADRYAYIPFIGLFVMLTWLVADWIAERDRGGDTRSLRSTGIPATGLAIAAVLYLIGLGRLT